MTRNPHALFNRVFGAVLVAIGAMIIFVTPPSTWSAAPALKPSAVIVNTTTGHGSGVYLGNGLVVTAAHVVDGTDDFMVAKRAATVLWSSKAYDIALLSVDLPDTAAANLTCRAAVIGEDVKIVGNPLNVRDFHSYGKVAGVALQRGDWKSAILTDLTVAPGMSGGPMYDAGGNVLGIVVGGVLAPTGFMSASILRLGFVVPSSAVCKLLGRMA